MIKLELSLSELNELYYAMSKHVSDERKNANEYGGWFADKLSVVEQLEEKIADALHIEAKKLDLKYNISFPTWL